MAAVQLPGFRPEDDVDYVKAGASQQLDDNNCAALGLDEATGLINLANTSDPSATPLKFKRSEIAALRQGFADGDFDHLA